ncbi:hypothetical protein BBBOND_0105800 [Babesia bigemina]|uniref:RAP domain-containing protein n=1 Tax=Babesia bigemina TaxID=5866 RepID=A0A061D0B5_BABBI|nr:hypothetical protein BBBOND_0105800 [Babesia bigemina]CDR94271.1 hypothetical protein BBBOND_0105800 [Babesia bigemina]|eukprot:XP_012766457.1 hypothetical protein BBBOND_0105800 [Babesia bigemina]
MWTRQVSKVTLVYKAAVLAAKNRLPLCRYLNRCFVTSRSQERAEKAVRSVEQLCLEQRNCAETAQRASATFHNGSNDMSDLQIVRGMNAFANVGFANQVLLLVLSERIQEICENASPIRVAHTLTLLKRMHVTHPAVIDHVMLAVKRYLHNYVAELPDIVLNCSHVGCDDADLIEMFRSQAMLHYDTLGARSIRCAEALSRFRSEQCAVLDRVMDTYLTKLENLTIKQLVYLLSATSRSSKHEASAAITGSLLSHIASESQTPDNISRLLLLQSSSGVALARVLDTIMDSMELMMDNPKYVTDTLPYHIYLLCLLERGGHRSTLAFLERSLKNPVTLLSPSSACQLLYAISIVVRHHGKQVVEDRLGVLLRHMNSCYKRLSLKQQEELYESLLFIQAYEELPGSLSHFVASKIPSRLPTMCGGGVDLQLDTIEGVSYVLFGHENVARTALVCVSESEALTVLDDLPSVSMGPRAQQYSRTLEHLFSKNHTHGCVPAISYNVSTNLSRKLVF